MEPIALPEVVTRCHGELRHGGREVSVWRICSDTRQVQTGDLFVALPGDRFDGHDFLWDAMRQGAAALLVERERAQSYWPAIPTVAVGNTRRALGMLAASYRQYFQPAVVAIAGSNGKTTTKELLAAVLRTRMETLCSPASFNNDIGVPQTLLQLEKKHRAAVLEVGTNHPGELAPLVHMIQPRWGVITSIGREHLEFFGDLEGVAREEGTLAEMLPADGRLFINGDTPKVHDIIGRAHCPVVTVGFAPEHPWRVVEVRMDGQGTVFEVRASRAEFNGEYRVQLLGRHQALNAVLAMAVAAELGLRPDEVRSGLAQCLPAKMRLQLSETRGVRIVDDAYNANADSMLAALATLREIPCSGRRVAVLGDMEELGAQSQSAHAEVGRQAAASGLASLFAVGRWAKVVTDAARAAGLVQSRDFESVEAAAAAVRDYLVPGDLVLLKASRAVRMERLGEVLRSCSTI
jgi:UDP-N-acetylmuramoyl-tripeptide--D-alanyl-D-alanine ligase